MGALGAGAAAWDYAQTEIAARGWEGTQNPVWTWEVRCWKDSGRENVGSIPSVEKLLREDSLQPVHPDPCPELPIERGPNEDGVGSWVPEQKHRRRR